MEMNEIGFYRKSQFIKQAVEELKKEGTGAEKILRSRLRDRKIGGYKFYRQKAIFVYRENESRDRFIIADFYNHEHKLIIEVDGGIHNTKIVKDHDKLKEFLMSELGHKIIRFTNEEIINDTCVVIKKIKEECLM